MNRLVIYLMIFISAAALAAPAIMGKISDDDGKPLAGIRVTDGFSVTLSDAEGEYSLEVTPRSTIISVVTPADRRTDRFWLRLEPDRTAGYDFSLVPRPKRDSFSFIQISDEEESSPLTAFYADVRDRALAEDAAFVISTGDLCYENGIRSAGKYMVPENFGGIRTYVTLGNHDLIGENGSGDAFYEQQCGPTRYAFIEGNVLFIVLPMTYGDRKPSYTRDDIARFTKAMLDTWEKGKPVFFASHYYVSYIYRDMTFAPSSEYAFSLADWKMSGFIYGHTHWYYACTDTPVPLWSTGQSRSGGGGNMPGAMRIFHMEADGSCTTELAESNVPPHLTGLCAPDGTITAVASATAGVFTSVKAEADGETITLQKQNSWLWSGKGGKPFSNVTLTAELLTGREVRTMKATCQPDSDSLVLERIIPLENHVLFGEPLLAGGRIIVGLADEDDSKSGGIIAFDAENGKKVWEYTTGYSVRNSIIARDGMIYACDANNSVYKLAAKDGELLWTNIEPSPDFENNCHMAPALGEGKVFAGSGSVLRAIDEETGRTLWKAAGNREIFGSTMGPVYDNGKVFLAVNWGYLQAFEAETGKLLWSTKDMESSKGFLFQPTLTILEDGSILRCEGTHGVSLFNSENGELLREMEKPETLSTASRPLVSNGLVFSGASKTGACAVDLATLETRWTLAETMKNNALLATVQYGMPMKTMEATPVLADDKLLCAGVDGLIYILRPEDGTLLGSFDTGAPLLGAPVCQDGKLYIADYAGRLLQFAFKEK